MNKELKNLNKEYGYLLKPLGIIMLVYFFAFSSIIRANYNYGDDIERLLFGVGGWTNFSRFTTESLSIYIHTSNYLTDISPLTQYIAIFLLAVSSVILLHLFKKDKRITLSNIISVIFVGVSPYFLSCISYKYDSPYMALSILASLLPFIFYKSDQKNKTNDIIYSLLVIVGTIIMCTTYQAASGIIPMVTIFLAFDLWNNKNVKESLRLVFLTAIDYVIGLLIFKLFIVVPSNYYAAETMFSMSEMIPGFVNNLLKYYKFLISDFRNIWFFFIGIIFIAFVFCKVSDSKQDKKIALIGSLVFIIMTLLVVFGLYPCLEKTIFAPRTMYAVGVLISLYSINITSRKEMYLSKFIIFCLAWCFVSFSFTYGNCLSVQKEYIGTKIQMVLGSLNELEIMNRNVGKVLKIEGDMGFAKAIENMPLKYKGLVVRLMQQRFWNNYYLANFYDLGNVKIYLQDDKLEYDLEVVLDTLYYSISINSNYNFILLKFK